jgi:hypothetical protein
MAEPGSPEPPGQLIATDMAVIRGRNVGRVCRQTAQVKPICRRKGRVSGRRLEHRAGQRTLTINPLT